MSIKILTKNGVENTNKDSVRDFNFNAGMRSGIVRGALNEGNLFLSSSNTLAFDTCELRLCGHRVVLDDVYYTTFNTKPVGDARFMLVATINTTNGVEFLFEILEASTALVQNNLNKEDGKFQLEIGRFTLKTDGTLEDIVRTADLITGGVGGGNGSNFEIGNVITNEINYKLPAEVDIEKRFDLTDKKTYIDVTVQSPTDFTSLENEVNEGLGKTIQSIEKTGTSGLVDTYTITLANGSTSTFTVTNGKGITNIEKTATSGLVDTYTITFNDNTTSSFQVTNGAKGDKGDTGESGTPAGFGTPTATIDNNVGTPSVTITATGENIAKVFNFEFKNLKGQKGDKGDTGDSGGVSLPIGMIFPSAIELTDARFHLLDGGTIAKEGIYAEFATMLEALYPNGDYTETQYTNDLNQYGQCGHFVIGADTVRLPKITKFIEGLDDISNIGTSLEAGLPNITGERHLAWGDTSGGGIIMDVKEDDLNSALYASSYGSTGWHANTSTTGPSSSYLNALSIDASRSNQVYGNSDTVQPQSTQYPYYIVLASGYKTDVPIDIDKISTDLNNKASKDALETKANKDASNIGTTLWKEKLNSYFGAGRYVTIGWNTSAGDQQYTAPANGYICFSGAIEWGANGRIRVGVWRDNDFVFSVGDTVFNQFGFFFPVRKGDVVQVEKHVPLYQLDIARFYYAE